MRNELSELEKKLARLETSTSNKVPKIRYTPVDADGVEGEMTDVFGSPCESGDVDFQIPKKIYDAFMTDAEELDIAGARGPGKTWSACMFVLGYLAAEPCKAIFLRSVEGALKHSSYDVLSKFIRDNPALRDFWEIHAFDMVANNGSIIVFKGITKNNALNLQSFEGFKFWILEESQGFDMLSIETVRGTPRVDGCRIIYIWNPYLETDPIVKEIHMAPSSDTSIAHTHLTLYDNPFAPEVLLRRAARDKERNYEKFAHTWLGEFRQASEARIYSNWEVKDFDIQEIVNERLSLIRDNRRGTMQERRERIAKKRSKIENAFVYGMDHGWTNPLALVKAYLIPEERVAFICKEFLREKVPIVRLPKIVKDFDKSLERGSTLRVDCARPAIIDDLRRNGIRAVPCNKPGLIERIDALSLWKIYIHVDCVETQREFQNYSWEENANGDISKEKPRAMFNHLIDSLIYSMDNVLFYENVGEYRQLKNPFV